MWTLHIGQGEGKNSKILILMRLFNEISICDEMFLKIKLFGYCFYTVFILIFKEPGRWKILNVPLPSQEWVKMEKSMTYFVP